MEKPSLWRAFIPKARIIGGFAKHIKDHEKVRTELLKFVEQMVQDFKNEEEEKVSDEHYRFRVRKFSVQKPTKARYTDKDIEYTFSKEGYDEFCFECRKQFAPFSKDVFPCRTCTRAFHKSCVNNLKDSKCSQNDKDCMVRAHENTGWSCHYCSDLSLLLTDKEISKVVDTFDAMDTNKDGFISEEEYTNFKLQNLHLGMTDSGKEQITLQFKKLDTDKDGMIKYNQFAGNEAKIQLAKRSTDDLLDILSEKEVVHAKAFFSRLDDDNDGFITFTDSMIAYKSWYRRFDDSKDGRDTKSLHHHADVAAKIIMDHDKTHTGLVNWEEFIAGQALYIICARPNV